jgi:hypothetical protein
MNKSILVVLLLFFVLGCKMKNEKKSEVQVAPAEKELSSIEVDDINAIVKAILVQDSLKVFKSDPYTNFLCVELRRLPIDIPKELGNGLVPPPAPGRKYISHLLNDKINNELFFTTKDSAILLAQNANPAKFKIDKSILKNVNCTSIEKEISKKKNPIRNRFYQLTIPIFSVDGKKAYVELDYNCGALCGNGKSIYLKKIKGKWTIVEKVGTWIS